MCEELYVLRLFAEFSAPSRVCVICVCLQQLRFMKTPHQFLLRSSPPAKEAAFVTARNAHGSAFAFQ